jgi:hypothetical protein
MLIRCCAGAAGRPCSGVPVQRRAEHQYDSAFSTLRLLFTFSVAELQPTFIVLYDLDLEMLRRVEIYKSLSRGVPIR